MADKRHIFFIEMAIRGAIEVGRSTRPLKISALYMPGSRILLATYQLSEDEDIYKTCCDVATSNAISGEVV